MTTVSALTAPELPRDWHSEAAGKLSRLHFYADRRVATAASAAYEAAWWWGQNTKYDDPDDPEFDKREQRYDAAELELLVLMREALSIPEGDLTLPPSGSIPAGGWTLPLPGYGAAPDGFFPDPGEL